MVLDSWFKTEVSECAVVKLLFVVQDKHLGYPISANDVPPNKIPNFLFCDSG